MKTHMPLDGLEIGDVGAKIALKYSDNGYMKFNHYKAPKSALLSRYVKIDEEGNFTGSSPEQQKLVYGGMLEIRLGIIYSAHVMIGH